MAQQDDDVSITADAIRAFLKEFRGGTFRPGGPFFEARDIAVMFRLPGGVDAGERVLDQLVASDHLERDEIGVVIAGG